MRIGLMDVDGHNYPNIPLMKLSAWHKQRGDTVEWYDAFNGLVQPYDKVYLSKVFSFSPDYDIPIYAHEVVRGGSGYAISLTDGKEHYDKSKDNDLPYEIEHIYPDYDLYAITDTAYGFLSRGCPRGCSFCHVQAKEGAKSYKVAGLSEFWHGQKNIVLCDPNILACRERKELLQQLMDSRAWVDFNQGLDIRLMTDEIADMLKQIKIKKIHFAWDRYEDKDIVQPRFEAFKTITQIDIRKLIVFVLCGDRERRVTEEDRYRVYWLRDHGYNPFVMLYDKEHLTPGHQLKKFQRWCNNRATFASCKRFEDYKEGKHDHLEN